MSATAKPKGTKKPAPAPVPDETSWRAANAHRPAGTPRKWTEELQRELIREVKRSDKRGTNREDVYDMLSEKWSQSYPDEVYTPHQVSSQFHGVKLRFGYDVMRQTQRHGPDDQPAAPRVRRVTAPPRRSPLERAAVRIEKLEGQLAWTRQQLQATRVLRDDAVSKLRAIRASLR